MRNSISQPLRNALLDAQNRDGGWGYNGPASWTEPTALALLALGPDGGGHGVSGLKWLRSMQRHDGGWRPGPSVDESTWVTALAVLALARAGDVTNHTAAARWLLRQSGAESRWTVRLRQVLLGVHSEQDQTHTGWPWFPGAAAWVMPTALTVLALQALRIRGEVAVYDARIAEGREFLLARRCSDGGWNHGSSRALGYESASYPETTGVAILALAGSRLPGLARTIACAESHLEACRVRSAFTWLQLGLLANGVTARDWTGRIPALPAPRDVTDMALTMLAERAVGGDNVFLR